MRNRKIAVRLVAFLIIAGLFLFGLPIYAYAQPKNPPGPKGGPGTNWENPPGPKGGPGRGPDRRPTMDSGAVPPADPNSPVPERLQEKAQVDTGWEKMADANKDGVVDAVEINQWRNRHRHHRGDNPPGPQGGPGTDWNNPPGPKGGPGTNWENPPGPKGGPGASPDRRPGPRR